MAQAIANEPLLDKEATEAELRDFRNELLITRYFEKYLANCTGQVPLTATAVVRYRKLNNQYARWALKRADAGLPIVDMAKTTLTFPVREKPKIVEPAKLTMK